MQWLCLLCDYGGTFEGSSNLFLRIESFLFTLAPEVIDEFQYSILAHNFEAHINVQENTFLLHDESSVEAWPDFDLVGVQRMSLCCVEAFSADGLKSQASHEWVEKDLEEVHVVLVCGFHELHPLNADGILDSIMFSLELGNLLDFLQTVDAISPFNEEV